MYKKFVFAVAVLAGIILVNGSAVAAEEFDVDRIAGDNRIETVVEISRVGWDDANNVVIARKDDYADALAGVTMAYSIDAPILLTSSEELFPEVEQEIKRLNPEHIVILGGPMAISYDVGEELEELAKTFRYEGIDRFATARKIAEDLFEGEDVDKSVVAYGYDFPDALAVGPYAADNYYPILLTNTDRLSSRTDGANTTLDVQGTYTVGGTAVISDTVYNELPNSTRLAGQNRYETAVAINEHFADDDTDHIYMVTGQDFAHAIAGSVLAARRNTGILLVSDWNKNAALNYVKDNGIDKVTILGNINAVSEDIETYFSDAGNGEEEENGELDYKNGYDPDAEYEVPEDTDLKRVVGKDFGTCIYDLRIDMKYEFVEGTNDICHDATQDSYEEVESILASKFRQDVVDDVIDIMKQKDNTHEEIEGEINLSEDKVIYVSSNFTRTWVSITIRCPL